MSKKLVYSGRIHPVEAGQVISVAGKVSNNPQRFDINLLTGNKSGNDSGDVQLHISVRFQAPEPVVIRNSHKRGVGWGNEEKRENLILHNNNINPLKRGSDFKIDIFVDQAAFFITIDGKPFCTFNHRLPLNGIQLLTVIQDVDKIYQVNQISTQFRTWPAIDQKAFEAFSPRQFSPGNVVVVTCVPRGHPSGDFHVNFYEGSSRSRFYFHVRVYLDANSVVANSMNDDEKWHNALTIRPQPFPFRLNQMFKLAIAITNNEFQVAANGRRILSYPYKNYQKMFNEMTGIGINSSRGLNLEVQSVEYKNVNVASGFESFTAI